jgi:hypothetical protein
VADALYVAQQMVAVTCWLLAIHVPYPSFRQTTVHCDICSSCALRITPPRFPRASPSRMWRRGSHAYVPSTVSL